MIGIACKESEKQAVDEFFQLFKTPWEFLRLGQEYDVVVSTLEADSNFSAKVVVLYSSETTQLDHEHGIAVEKAISGDRVLYRGTHIPVYGWLARVESPGSDLLYESADCVSIGIAIDHDRGRIIRIGYDLWREVDQLLSEGQSVSSAPYPTLEYHIGVLRECIVSSGIPLAEIPPIPSGHQFIACLTHDVDFVAIRYHTVDHTLLGFLFRSLLGSVVEVARGRLALSKLVQNWVTAVSLPLVWLGVIEDPWNQFAAYKQIEDDLRSTFFIIPFKNRSGEMPCGDATSRRAARYDVTDINEELQRLIDQGDEIGLHGIDAWHDARKGREEAERIAPFSGNSHIGVRMHWLCFDQSSFSTLEQAGFTYDSTAGYNEAIGYKCGTTQAFRPLGVDSLLELPLHIQDTALFYPDRLALTDRDAWDECMRILDIAADVGGVVTILWHLRSLAPERLWGDFYSRLLTELRQRGAWFGTAREVTQWFRLRRSIIFEDCKFDSEKLHLRMNGEHQGPPSGLFLRVHLPSRNGSRKPEGSTNSIDFEWDGSSLVVIDLESH